MLFLNILASERLLPFNTIVITLEKTQHKHTEHTEHKPDMERD